MLFRDFRRENPEITRHPGIIFLILTKARYENGLTNLCRVETQPGIDPAYFGSTRHTSLVLKTMPGYAGLCRVDFQPGIL